MSANLLLLFPSAKSVTSSDIDFTTTGAKNIGTQIYGGRFSTFLLSIFDARITSLSVNPIVSIGTNSPSYNNILDQVEIDAIGADYGFQHFDVSNGISIPNATAIKMFVNTAATASVYTAKINLGGLV